VDAADYHPCRPREKRAARENAFSKTAGNLNDFMRRKCNMFSAARALTPGQIGTLRLQIFQDRDLRAGPI
jgi:hypothetical protein